MADTPIVRAETWLKQHERLIIVALVLAVSAFGLNKYFDVASAKADAKVVIAEQLAADAKANATAAAITAAQTQVQYTALVQTLSAQNAALASAMATRNTVLQQTQAKTSQMTPNELVDTWKSLLPGKLDGKITQSSVKESDGTNTQNYTVELGPAIETVNALESIPVLTQNLTDETKIAGDYLTEVQKSDILSNDLTAQVTALNISLTTQAKACTLEIVAVKANGKKNSVKWFKRGLIVGFLGGLFVGHAAGI